MTDPTEQDARDLLARGAATIAVDDATPPTLAGLPVPSARRWPLLVAAAVAVAIVVGIGMVIAAQGGDEPAPGPVGVPTPSPSATLSPDQIPSLLGYREDEAVRELQRRGFSVSVRRTSVYCQPGGMVLGSEPAVGTHAAPGTKVIVEVTRQRTAIDCVGEPDWGLGWDLVRFARGLGGPPPLADDLVLHGPGDSTVTLTPSQAEQPRAWTTCGNAIACEGVLEALARVAEEPVPMGARFLPTSLSMGWGRTCRAGSGGPDHPQMSLEIAYPVDGRFCPRVQVFLREDSRSRLAEVWLVDSEDESRSSDGESSSGASDPRGAAADAFVAWARGNGPAPDFADRVRQFNGGLAPNWNDHPERRDGWSGCSGLGFPDCGIDPVGVIARGGKVVATPGRSTCPRGEDLPATYADATDDVVTLSQPEPATCGLAWAVELWIDDAGKIYAVNQVGSVASDDTRAAAASAFYLWANGASDRPPFARQVRLLYQDQVQHVMPGADADTGGRWLVDRCKRSTSRCAIDVTGVLGVVTGPPVITERETSACEETGRLPHDLAAARATDLVSINAQRAGACVSSWVVELWVRNDRIYAVDLVANPDSPLVSN